MFTGMVRLLLLVLVVVLLVRGIWRLLLGFVEGLTGEPGRVSVRSTMRLVRDPVCGTFILRSRALTAARGGTIEYFCSEQCRIAYESGKQIAPSATR